MFTIFHPEIETFARRMVADHLAFERGKWSPEDLCLHQNSALRETVQYVRSRSPFYREKFNDVTDEFINGLNSDTLQELPFTTKTDLRENMTRILSKPVSAGWIFYETTGTTGRSTPCPRDNVDSVANNAALTINYRSVVDAHPGAHLIGVMGPTELHSTGDTFGEVFRNLGHAVVKLWPHSPVVGYRRALGVMREFGVTALVCTPGMAMALAKVAEDDGLSPSEDFGIKFLMVVGELATPNLLRNIASIWGAPAYNSMYASQEVSIMAAIRADGKLRTTPLNNFFEVVDPASGRRVEADQNGVLLGELVVTHLYQGCKPLVRYRTGDVVRMLPTGDDDQYPSPILQPLGRVRDQVLVNDIPRYAYDLENTILSGVTHCHGFQLVIDDSNGEDELEIHFELAKSATKSAVDVAALSAVVSAELGLVPRIELHEIGSIATTGAMVSWKASRIDDRRAAPDAERVAALALAARRSARP